MQLGDRICAPSLRLLAFVIIAANAPPAHAISFHFSPASINIEARPGQIINQTLTLTLANDAKPTHFKARVEDWWRSADNLRTFYAAAGTISRSCGRWCSVNPVETAVKPGETLVVKVSLRVPDDAKPGGYWAALTVDEVTDPMLPKPTGVAMIFRASLSVGIYVEIPTATRAAHIVEIRISGQHATVVLSNDGNIPLRVTGTFEFYKVGEEQPVASVTFGGDPVLPEPINTCAFDASLPDAQVLPSGRYKVRAIVDLDLDHLLGAEKELDIVRSIGP